MNRVDVPFERAGIVLERGCVSVDVLDVHDREQIEEQLRNQNFSEFLVQDREYQNLSYVFGQPLSLPVNDDDDDTA